jgi:hypothetical protein
LAADLKGLEGEWVKNFDAKDGTTMTWCFVIHVDGSKLSGYMAAVGGRRRVPLEGDVQGSEASFLFDEHAQMHAKLLSADSLEIAFPPDKEGPRIYTFNRKTGFAATLPVPDLQIHGVDQSRMGPYRALAELAVTAARHNQYEQAARLAQILGRVWDRGELGLHTRRPEIWLQIDKAMDEFNGPIEGYEKKPVDAARLDVLYRNLLEKLKLGDYE